MIAKLRTVWSDYRNSILAGSVIALIWCGNLIGWYGSVVSICAGFGFILILSVPDALRLIRAVRFLRRQRRRQRAHRHDRIEQHREGEAG